MDIRKYEYLKRFTFDVEHSHVHKGIFSRNYLLTQFKYMDIVIVMSLIGILQ